MAFMTKKLKSSGVISGQDIDMTTASELIVFAKKNNIETSPLDVSRLTNLLGITMRLEPMKGEESGSLRAREKRQLGNDDKLITSSASSTLYYCP